MILAITLDVDPDANVPVPGRIDAVSPPVEAGQARFDAAEQGFAAAMDVLREAGEPSTVFLESRTAAALADRGLDVAALCQGHEIACHARRHEDLLGQVSGIKLSRDQIRGVIAEARETIAQVTGTEPTGFRAPYTRVDDVVLDVLAELGFTYDSSMTHDLPIRVGESPELTTDDGEPKPYRVCSSVWEAPLLSFRDVRGKKMTSYLWPLFESRRTPDEYVAAAKWFARAYPSGVFQFALHPWHLFCSESGEMFAPARAQQNCDALAEIIRRAADLDRVSIHPLCACIPAQA